MTTCFRRSFRHHRGLASIVFAIIVLNEDLPSGEYLAIVFMCMVGMSLVAHGISANPLANWIAGKDSATKST